MFLDLQIIVLLGRTDVRARQNIVGHLSAFLGQWTKKNVSYLFENDVFRLVMSVHTAMHVQLSIIYTSPNASVRPVLYTSNFGRVECN
jgi:hypothetical protein